MDNISQLEIRERYMQLSKKLLQAIEEGKPGEEIRHLQQQLKEMQPVLVSIENADPADFP